VGAHNNVEFEDQGVAPETPPEQIKAQKLEELIDALSEVVPRKKIIGKKKKR
jgi:hypothetical protein